MKGGYGTPIQSTCDLCHGPLTHKDMVNPVWLSTDWKYACGNCYGKVVDSWRMEEHGGRNWDRGHGDDDEGCPSRPEVTE